MLHARTHAAAGLRWSAPTHPLAAAQLGGARQRGVALLTSGQKAPPGPTMEHSCTHTAASSTEERKIVRDLKPSGKM